MQKKIANKLNDDEIDAHVDEKIRKCIKENKNFFMFAGAGSGKTRSLVKALDFIVDFRGEEFSMRHKRVAVITYTNAAADEVLRRVDNNYLLSVSTIHSFLWELIKPYQRDIKEWIKNKLNDDIKALEEKKLKARSRDHSIDIGKKEERVKQLDSIKIFSYDPNGSNVGKGSLNHSEVISMGAAFISEKETMQQVLASKFPILFIDESQDTKKELVDALLKMEKDYPADFLIGMFGDTLQRIYSDGKENLGSEIPKTWTFPVKKMNHRSRKRIIDLANAIRSNVDKQVQQPRVDKQGGIVRFFIADNLADKAVIEKQVRTSMNMATGDDKWLSPIDCKTLVLEHSMAASRLGFATLYTELYKEFDNLSDGDVEELSFLIKVIYPLVQARLNSNEFTVMRVLRESSFLFNKANIISSKKDAKMLDKISKDLDSLCLLWDGGAIPTCIGVYKKLAELHLFELPKRVEEVLSDEVTIDKKVIALRGGLQASFSELIGWWQYANEETQFATHQGIKGLEFNRVAVIMDDANSKGFMFSYDKLFGAKALSPTDTKNEAEGNDSSLKRTKRLLYVTCTRAIESLALIAYTSDVEAVKKTVASNGWFFTNEIIVLKNLGDENK